MTARLSITLEQPVQASTRGGTDSVIRSEPFIPGWQLRGALAAAWIRKHGVPNRSPERAVFERLFESEVRYGPAFVGSGPRSFAVYRHKYKPEENCTMPTQDRAMTDADKEACTTCDQEWVPFRGLSEDDDVKTGRRTGVEIGDDGIAVDEKLFVRESIPRGRVLSGDVICSDTDLLDELIALGCIQIGGRRTSYGLAQLDWDATEATPARGGTLRKDGRVVVRTVSPAVFVDQTGRPSSAPDEAELEQWFGQKATIVRAWTRWDEIGGWHAASRLPKPIETVVAAGSTYLLEVEERPDQATLERLWARGVGLRRHEGFGHLARGEAQEAR